ncbi:hypothetical protein M408DRAFT_20593 [Serendipita vermifera MAFF 305830]|uniref:Uncharacterized protein n=1 Tax=Serendipita vermifera MAFF 305830 TaxID=933852 RepID=A0A0C3BJL6_SERVB|nr:hypothetical protein M408DRAFT_20593 [Serendipita vermifera MAFF 305830]
MDLMGISGSIRAGVILDTLLFVTGAASYGWGYESCRPEGSDARATTSFTINGATVNFSDEAPVCPTVTKLMHNGTLNIGTETTVWVDMTSPRVGKNITQSTIYIGHFILEAKAIEPVTSTSTPAQASTFPTPSTTSTTPTSSSVSSASSSSNSTTSGTQTTRLNGINDNISLSDSSSASSGIGGVPEANVSNSSSDTMQSKLPGIIGGTVAGICAIFILLFFLWRRHQHHKREIADAVPYDGEATWSPYAVNPTLPGHGHGGFTWWWPIYPPTPSTQEGHAPEMRSANETLQIQNNVSRVEHPISLVTTAGGLPAYDTYMDAPLVTFRRHLGMAPDAGEEEIVNDSLHEWAEGNRDFVPPHLERRLRAGGYVPGSNPSDLSPEHWLTNFGVTRYELAGLQELYERGNTFRVL